MNYTSQLELMYSPTITYFLNIFTMALASIGLTVSSTTWFDYGRPRPPITHAHCCYCTVQVYSCLFIHVVPRLLCANMYKCYPEEG